MELNLDQEVGVQEVLEDQGDLEEDGEDFVYHLEKSQKNTMDNILTMSFNMHRTNKTVIQKLQ